jgi:hypothetical protein
MCEVPVKLARIYTEKGLRLESGSPLFIENPRAFILGSQTSGMSPSRKLAKAIRSVEALGKQAEILYLTRHF